MEIIFIQPIVALIAGILILIFPFAELYRRSLRDRYGNCGVARLGLASPSSCGMVNKSN